MTTPTAVPPPKTPGKDHDQKKAHDQKPPQPAQPRDSGDTQKAAEGLGEEGHAADNVGHQPKDQSQHTPKIGEPGTKEAEMQVKPTTQADHEAAEEEAPAHGKGAPKVAPKK